MLIDICTEACERIFNTATNGLGVKTTYRPIIAMKNEFVYSTLLTTSNKKSYAGMFTAKLGKKLQHPKLDMKGLQISKSNSPKILRNKFQNLLVNKILMPKKVNLIDILNEYQTIENTISKSLHDGKLEYGSPTNVAAIASYDIPERQIGVRGTLVWNELEPNHSIQTPERVKIIKLNCTDENDPRLLQLKINDKKKYDAIIKTVFKNDGTNGTMNMRHFGFTAVALPQDLEKIPDYLIQFIDYDEMINKNLKNANILLKCLSIMCVTDTNKLEHVSSVCLL